MKKIILISSIILFIGCGGEKSQNAPTTIDKTKPTSPITKEKEKTPPSIPNI